MHITFSSTQILMEDEKYNLPNNWAGQCFFSQTPTIRRALGSIWWKCIGEGMQKSLIWKCRIGFGHGSRALTESKCEGRSEQKDNNFSMLSMYISWTHFIRAAFVGKFKCYPSHKCKSNSNVSQLFWWKVQVVSTEIWSCTVEKVVIIRTSINKPVTPPFKLDLQTFVIFYGDFPSYQEARRSCQAQLLHLPSDKVNYEI